MQSAPIGWMVRAGMLFFQMNERPSDLDEAFIIEMVFVAALQPERLQNIVRFIVVFPVEALEEACIARVVGTLGGDVERFEQSGYAFVFQHEINSWPPLNQPMCGHRVCRFE